MAIGFDEADRAYARALGAGREMLATPYSPAHRPRSRESPAQRSLLSGGGWRENAPVVRVYGVPTDTAGEFESRTATLALALAPNPDRIPDPSPEPEREPNPRQLREGGDAEEAVGAAGLSAGLALRGRRRPVRRCGQHEAGAAGRRPLPHQLEHHWERDRMGPRGGVPVQVGPAGDCTRGEAAAVSSREQEAAGGGRHEPHRAHAPGVDRPRPVRGRALNVAAASGV